LDKRDIFYFYGKCRITDHHHVPRVQGRHVSFILYVPPAIELDVSWHLKCWPLSTSANLYYLLHTNCLHHTLYSSLI
jgi:hypothetical protein